MVLDELGLSLLPKMPTAEVCEQFDALLQSIVALLEMKRQMDKLEQELRILQHRKAELLAAQTPAVAAEAEADAAGPSSAPVVSNVRLLFLFK